VAVDEDLNVFVADTGNNLIRRVDAAGNVTTLAGGGTQAQGDVPGDQAEFALPSGLVVLPDASPRTLLVADSGHQTLRTVVLNTAEAPRVNELAGLCDQAGAREGDPATALFNNPDALTLGGGLCLVADTRNNLIREVHANARGGYDVATLAGAASGGGQGLADGGPSRARFAGPRGMAFGGDGNLYVADGGNGAVRQITPQGVVTTLAGGPAQPIPSPVGLVPVPGPGPGRLLVASALGPALFSLDLVSGARTLFSGQPGAFGSATGPPSSSAFQSPGGLAADDAGNLYLADGSAALIYKITPGGDTSILAGQANQHGNQDDPLGANATFMAPVGLAWADHALYVADQQGQTIRRIDPATTAVTTFAGLGGAEGYVDEPGGSARFNGPSGLAADAAGNLFVADTFNHAVRMLTPGGQVTTVVGRPGQSGCLPGDLPGLLYRPAWVAVQPGTGDLFLGVPDAILQVHFR
jgi:sugar lactone lactonase YvrE